MKEVWDIYVVRIGKGIWDILRNKIMFNFKKWNKLKNAKIIIRNTRKKNNI